MDIDIFSLCDGAFNYNGRLSIIGTYDQISVSEIPKSIRTSFAMKLTFLRSEIVPDMRLSVSFRDSQNNLVASGFECPVIAPTQPGGFVHVALAYNIEMSISSLGNYKVVLAVNGEERITRSFSVVLNH